MKFYFAGTRDETVYGLIASLGAHYLFSFAEAGSSKTIKGLSVFHPEKIFLDSGAFSMATRGIKLVPEDYASFVKKSGLLLYANLDVIGDAAKTLDNLKALESLGLKPLPVFHYGAPDEVIKWYCSHYDYVAIGGLVPISRDWPRLCGFLDRVFNLTTVNGKPHRFHGFGMGAPRCMLRYPFYSVDSTGWFRHAVFNDPRHAPSGIRRIIRRTGTRKIYLGYEIGEYLRREKAATEIWTKRGITWEK